MLGCICLRRLRGSNLLFLSDGHKVREEGRVGVVEAVNELDADLRIAHDGNRHGVLIVGVRAGKALDWSDIKLKVEDRAVLLNVLSVGALRAQGLLQVS